MQHQADALGGWRESWVCGRDYAGPIGRGLVGHNFQGARVISARFLVPAKLIERRALHRENPPIGLSVNGLG